MAEEEVETAIYWDMPSPFAFPYRYDDWKEDIAAVCDGCDEVLKWMAPVYINVFRIGTLELGNTEYDICAVPSYEGVFKLHGERGYDITLVIVKKSKGRNKQKQYLRIEDFRNYIYAKFKTIYDNYIQMVFIRFGQGQMNDLYEVLRDGDFIKYLPANGCTIKVKTILKEISSTEPNDVKYIVFLYGLYIIVICIQ